MDFPTRFMSLRDKNGSSRRNKSAAREAKQSRPFSGDAFKSMFKSEQSKHDAQTDSETAKEASKKIEQVQRRLDKLNITNVSVEHIRDIMATMFAEGDPARTAEFIDMEQKASAALISPYDPNVLMVGAENRSAVTCYIDALLFAMFAKLEAFECMLKTDFPQTDPRHNLVNLLRIWVNMLRAGKLIRTDLTKLLQNAMADCGWPDAQRLEQQDTSEAFGFITETLQLPLLSLQVDLFHQGKKDVADHKIVYERLLNLAVPPDPDDKGIKLEDCLEEYFNAQVHVHRDSVVGKTSIHEDQSSEASFPSADYSTSDKSARGDASLTSGTTVASPTEVTPSSSLLGSTSRKDDSPSSQMSVLNRSTSMNDAIDPIRRNPRTSSSLSPSGTRKRAASLIQRIVVDEKGQPTDSDGGALAKKTTRQGSTVVKAITIPAWQFFRLIPWHAVEGKEPRNISEVAMNFDQRPVVGICLKRYAMTESGQPKRLNTYIDIPDSLRLPHFMLADGENMEEFSNGLNTEYKLVLQSVICHRGDSLQSGHYIAFARVAPKLLTNNRRHEFDPPPDYEEAQWVKFDDLELEHRVSPVGDIREALKAEMPYLLFYQIVPRENAACPTPGGTGLEVQPPSYDEFRISFDAPQNDRSNSMPTTPSRSRSSFIDDPFMVELNRMANSKPPSIRLSTEVDRGFRNGPRYGSHSDASISRRQSVVFTDATFANATSAITPDAQSFVGVSEDEPSTASRLSRAASRFTFGSKSRPVSQSSESRLSNTMNRLGFVRPSKELLRDPSTSTPSFSIAAGDRSAESSKPTSMDLPPEAKLQQEQQTHLTLKLTKHKRTKSKEKGVKHKTGEPPDRECVVM